MTAPRTESSVVAESGILHHLTELRCLTALALSAAVTIAERHNESPVRKDGGPGDDLQMGVEALLNRLYRELDDVRAALDTLFAKARQ